MRLVSFDVGIKNLAYCIFVEGRQPLRVTPLEGVPTVPPIREVEVEGLTESGVCLSPSTSKVVSWTVANLLEPETPVEIHPCSYELTKKRKSDLSKLCGKVAKYQTPGSCSSYFCETHAKKSAEYLLPKKEYTLSKLKNKRIDALQTACREAGVDVAGLKKPEIAEKLASWYEGRMFRQIGQIYPKKTAGETDLISIGRAIKRVLDADPEIRGATHVIIENQISTIASRMKTIQGMIAQYFIMQDRHIEIEFVSSHNKLKGQKRDSDTSTLESSNRPSKYKKNKSDGVAICRQSLEETPNFEPWRPMFEASKKKDDLADCFLQGMWYLNKK
jgi:hypothetical protein